MKIKLLVLLFVAAMSTLGCSGGNDNTIETVDLSLPEHPPTARLPEGIVPTHYTLHLEIDPRLDRFRGSATIDIELAAATSFLWLHGLDLNITSARAISGGDSIELGWTQASPHGVAKLTAQSTPTRRPSPPAIRVQRTLQHQPGRTLQGNKRRGCLRLHPVRGNLGSFGIPGLR